MNGHLNPCIVFKKCKPSFQQILLHGEKYFVWYDFWYSHWPMTLWTSTYTVNSSLIFGMEWNGIQKTIGKPDQVIACFCFYLPLWHHLCEWTPISTCSMYPMKLERDLIGANPSVVLGFLLFTFTHTPSVELCLFSPSM